MKKILSIVALLAAVIAIITSQILLIHCPHKLAFNAGTYEVQVDGHNDIIRVGVTFSDSSIVAINVLEQHETPQIGAIVFDKLIPEIIRANGLGVDAVSGATVTSQALKKAVMEAAEQAGVSDPKLFRKATLPKEKHEPVDDTWDVVIVGGGGAGLFAAAQAAEDGNTVLVIEKNAELGGNTLQSGGMYQSIDHHLVWDMNNPEATTAIGFDGQKVEKVKATVGSIDVLKTLLSWDEKPFDAQYYLTHEFVAGDVAEQAKHGVHQEYLDVLRNLKKEIRAYLAYAEPKLQKGVKESDLLLFSTTNLHIFQTYYGGLRQSSDKKEWIYGDYDLVCQFIREGEKLKPWLMDMGVEYKNLQVTLPGAIWYRCNIMDGCNTDADGDGKKEFYEKNWGVYVMAPLTRMLSANEHNQVLRSTTAKNLIIEKGRVTGVEGAMDDGTPVVAHARKGVIIASGGYAANVKKVLETNKYWPTEYLTNNIGTTNLPALVGEGLTMAAAAGADECGEGWTQLMPIGFTADGLLAKGSIETAVFISPETGKRFVDECSERDVLSLAAFRNGITYKGIKGTFLCIRANVKTDNAGLDIISGDVPGKEWIRTGKELAALFKELGLKTDAKTVLETIREYDMAGMENRQPKDVRKQHQVGLIGTAKCNADGSYDKSTYDIDNAKLRIRLLAPSLHHTMGGLRIDTSRRVLDKNGKPIPGLFAAGEVTGGIHGGNRLGGNALTEIMVSGRIAAENINK
jgi:fumarate reductase flavoprotein subunit